MTLCWQVEGRKKRYLLRVSTQQARNVYTLGPVGENRPLLAPSDPGEREQKLGAVTAGAGGRAGRQPLVVPKPECLRTKGEQAGRGERGRQAQAGGQAGGSRPRGKWVEGEAGLERQPQTGPGRSGMRPWRPRPTRGVEIGRRHARPASPSGTYHLRVQLRAF